MEKKVVPALIYPVVFVEGVFYLLPPLKGDFWLKPRFGLEALTEDLKNVLKRRFKMHHVFPYKEVFFVVEGDSHPSVRDENLRAIVVAKSRPLAEVLQVAEVIMKAPAIYCPRGVSSTKQKESEKTGLFAALERVFK